MSNSFLKNPLSIVIKNTLAISAVMASVASASEYGSVVFFGDSLTDSGYFRPALVQAGYEAQSVGEFSTNPDRTWSSYFASKLGTSATPNIPYANQVGNNYAIGGARAGVGSTNTQLGGLPVTSVANQVATYLASNSTDKTGLYVVWVGANDLFTAASQSAQGDSAGAQSTLLNAVASTVDTIDKLHQAGATYVLVPNIPDVGLTPQFVNTSLASQATATASLYNQMLMSRAGATGANVIALDTFGLLQQVAANPTAYGFSNMSDTACATTSSLLCGQSTWLATASDANDSYFFADGVHPTGRAHQMIADYAYAVVTAPTQMSVVPYVASELGRANLEQVQSRIASRRDTTGTQMWASALGSQAQVAGLESDGGVQAQVGVDVGYEKTLTGLYLNYGDASFDKTNQSLRQLEINEVGLGAYHASKVLGAHIHAGVNLSWLDVDSRRAVEMDSFSTEHQAAAEGKRYSAHLQAGYPVMAGKVSLMPYVGADVQRVRVSALQEEGSDATAMTFDEQKYTQSRGKVGVDAKMAINDKVGVFADVHYHKELSSKRQDINARLNSIPSTRFSTPTIVRDSEDGVGATLGVSANLSSVTLGVGVNHNQSGDDDHTRLFVSAGMAF